MGRDVESEGVNEFDALSREELSSRVGILHEENRELKQTVTALAERVADLEKENEALRSQLPGAGNALPPFVKPNRKGRREQEIHGLYGVHISVGEISEIPVRVAACGKREADRLLEEIGRSTPPIRV